MLRSLTYVLLLAVTLSGCGPSEPKTAGAPPVLRRLTEDQYRRIVADVFGADIVIGGRFDPLVRTAGLLAVGAGTTAINGAAFDSYDALARSVAGQVTDEKHRGWLIDCKPADPSAADDVCAKRFFTHIGRLLYRRQLTDTELAEQMRIAGSAAKELGGFYPGVGASLAAMMVAPEFLFIADATEADPAKTDAVRLTPYAKASRLSFLLWNSSPDEALLTAAEKGELEKSGGIAKQVDRMLASPRLEFGVRAFFADMLAFDGFETLQKDSVIYPAFGLATANDAREQTLRTIVDALLVKQGDYRDLFTTRKTFLTVPLGMVYRVPAANPDGWTAFEFPQGDAHVGIQSQIAFVALYSHPGRSSATIRGKAVRELLMCQKVPDPPSGVDFTLVSDSANPVYKTARQRLSAHATDPSCSGCHRLVDPIGLALENFDGAGQWRTTENGAPIDASGDLDSIKYADAAGLGKALHDSPAVTSCLVGRLASYATGRGVSTAERPWLQYLEQQFASDGYRLPSLLRRIALSDAFYAVVTVDARTADRIGVTEGKGPS